MRRWPPHGGVGLPACPLARLPACRLPLAACHRLAGTALCLSNVGVPCKASIPHLVAGGRGGSIIITSSVAGLRGTPNFAHYAAAKHGLVGLMRSLALELAPHSIRGNSVHPGNVNTPMVHNEDLYRMFMPPQREPLGGGVHREGEDQEPAAHCLAGARRYQQRAAAPRLTSTPSVRSSASPRARYSSRPNIHHWNDITFFSVERLREDVGFRPAYTFAAAVEHTYDWFRREKLDESLRFDFSWEDNLIERLNGR